MSTEIIDIIRDPRRLDVLQRLDVLTTNVEEPFDRLTRMVAKLLRVPSAVVVLFEQDRQVFKSFVGVPEPWASLREYPIEDSICHRVLVLSDPLLINDARLDPLVKDLPAIHDFKIVAYAGMPLRTTDEHVLGTLAVIDTKPRVWTEDDVQLLHDLAASVMTEIELRLVAREAEHQRQEAERQRKEIERQYQERSLLLERIADGFFALDTNWRFTYVNNLVEKLTQRSRAELIGKNIWEEFPEAVDTPFREQFQRAMTSQTPAIFEAFYPPFNRWFATRAYPSADGLSVYYQDVTEQKRVERLHAGQMQILEMIATGEDLSKILDSLTRLIEGQVDNMLCSILVVDDDGRRLRHGAAPSLPASYNGVIDGITICDTIGPCSTAAYRLEPIILEDIADVEGWDFFRDTALAHGLRACWSTPIVSGKGQVMGTFAMYYREPRAPTAPDHSLIEFTTHLAGIAIERKQIEAERLRLLSEEQAARAEAERALQVRDEFFSVAAHELKTPVTALVGYSQLLQRRSNRDGQGEQKNQRMINTLASQVQRLHRLTASLLDLSRLQSGSLTIDLVPIDLAALTREVIADIEATLHQHYIQSSIPDEPMLINGDRLRLEQVLYNLLQNAVKYSPEGGTIRVEVTRQAERLAIAVTDQGIGIPEHEVSQIFSRFFRGSNINRQQISGMGIGLYVVREIVVQHGGTISVQSLAGRGSTFTIQLPLPPTPQQLDSETCA